MDDAIRETVRGLRKMVVFDMDNTLLEGRFIEHAAQSFAFQRALVDIVTRNSDSYLVTKLIARELKGRSIAELLAVADSIPVVGDAEQVIRELHARGYVVGIITDSYDCIAAHVKTKVGADFVMANELEFSKSVATGEVKVPSYLCHTDASRCSHAFCKSNALRHALKNHGIDIGSVIAIGDSEADVCMIRDAGIGVAMCSSNKTLNALADHCLTERSFAPLLEFAE